jgi:hypothetical protein
VQLPLVLFRCSVSAVKSIVKGQSNAYSGCLGRAGTCAGQWPRTARAR